jgi:hypothetical protein
MAITLDGTNGITTPALENDGVTTVAAGSASAPAITTDGDTNTGIFFPAADTIAFAEGGAEAMRINSSGNVGIGTTSPAGKLNSVSTAASLTYPLTLSNLTDATTDVGAGIDFRLTTTNLSRGYIACRWTSGSGSNGTYLSFAPNDGSTGNVERMRIDSSGNLLVGTTTNGTTVKGIVLRASGETLISRDSDNPLLVNRLGNDGDLVQFRQANTQEGSISVSGTTVSYNGGHLSRWAQMLTKPDLLKGTVMSNLDEMNVYIAPTTYWTEEDELPVNEDGNPTVAVGDVKVETHEVQNEQLNKVKISDVEGDANVAGVFVNWDYDEAHQVDEINMAMTGDMIIRIAQGTTVARGDLLMSAGDGTAKPQGDDIVRSKTIAKVTSTHVTCTYDDGSYCVPCVLMAC